MDIRKSVGRSVRCDAMRWLHFSYPLTWNHKRSSLFIGGTMNASHLLEPKTFDLIFARRFFSFLSLCTTKQEKEFFSVCLSQNVKYCYVVLILGAVRWLRPFAAPTAFTAARITRYATSKSRAATRPTSPSSLEASRKSFRLPKLSNSASW